MTTLAMAALRAWKGWAAYMKHTTCARCREEHYCGAARRRGPWLCLDCFDQHPPRRSRRHGHH